MLIDPEQGWLYGFPKQAPSDFDSPEFNLREWLTEEGYPATREPYYVRYIEQEEDNE